MAERKRLFFCLWPPASVRKAIVQAADEAGIQGKRVAEARLHLTLAFLGDVDVATLERLLTHVNAINARAFDLQLDQLGYFARAQVVWLGPEQTPAALSALAAAVSRASANSGIPVGSQDFRAHVTLARRAAQPEQAAMTGPVFWPVRGFSLTESTQVNGAPVYRDLASWPV